ncbi:hypothetical protein JT358_04710 [Micrococcales bacterium 31B]|nr:hypothetical protein [Micrococcales bacterium 31B]
MRVTVMYLAGALASGLMIAVLNSVRGGRPFNFWLESAPYLLAFAAALILCVYAFWGRHPLQLRIWGLITLAVQGFGSFCAILDYVSMTGSGSGPNSLTFALGVLTGDLAVFASVLIGFGLVPWAVRQIDRSNPYVAQYA